MFKSYYQSVISYPVELWVCLAFLVRLNSWLRHQVAPTGVHEVSTPTAPNPTLQK